MVTPRPGKATIPVYGRAYPEQAAYPDTIPYQTISPLQYVRRRPAVRGRRVLPGEYYRAVSFDGSAPGDRTVVRGKNRYVQVQFGHRIMFVNGRRAGHAVPGRHATLTFPRRPPVPADRGPLRVTGVRRPGRSRRAAGC
ncbi:hypothetical protein V2I01_14120 [Micromonospora sp. BRA006-A]|nr:hypothetical protein [Micromonospora sp. BRA006-A]